MQKETSAKMNTTQQAITNWNNVEFNVEKTFDFVKTKQHWNMTLFQRRNMTLFKRWNLTLFQRWNLTLKQCWNWVISPNVETNNVVSTLKIGCSTSRPKINLKTTLKQRCVSAGNLLKWDWITNTCPTWVSSIKPSSVKIYQIIVKDCQMSMSK